MDYDLFLKNQGVNELKNAIIEGNLADVARLVSEVAKLGLSYLQYEPLIIEALKTENYDILKSVLDVAFARYNSNPLEWTFRQTKLKDKPIAARIIADYIVQFNLNLLNTPFVVGALSNNNILTGALLQLKRCSRRRHNHRVRWLVYILHQSGALSYDDLVNEPRLLSALAQWPEMDLSDFLQARVKRNGADRTLLYCVLIGDSHLTEKWKFVRTLESVCSATKREEDLPYGILNPDLTELAACIITHETKLFEHFVAKSNCPPLDKTIDHVPSVTSPAGRNLSHFFAKYWGARDFFQIAYKINCDAFDKMLITSDKQGNYSVNDLLRNTHPKKLNAEDFWKLIKAVETIIRRDQHEIEKFTFFRRVRLYWLDNSLALYLHQIGFRYTRLLESIGRYLPQPPRLMSFAASEIPIEFPIYELPIDLIALITANFSTVDVFAIFCVSKKCSKMKTLLLQSSFWNQYFKAKGPFKHAQYLNVPKEMQSDYVAYQNRFEVCLKQGLTASRDPSQPSLSCFLDHMTTEVMDDNWILLTDGSPNRLSLMNCWTNNFDPQTKFQIKQDEGNTVGNFVIINSTPTDLSFGYIERKSTNDTCTWHTYQNRQLSNCVSFKATDSQLMKPIYHNGKLFIKGGYYDVRCEAPSLTVIPNCHDVLDVNQLTGMSIFRDSSFREWILVDKSDQIVTKFSALITFSFNGKIRFINEHSLVASWKNGIYFFDTRKMSKQYINYMQTEIYVPNMAGEAVFSPTNQYAVLSDSGGARTVWDLDSRSCVSAFHLHHTIRICGINTRFMTTMPYSSPGTTLYSWDNQSIVVGHN